MKIQEWKEDERERKEKGREAERGEEGREGGKGFEGGEHGEEGRKNQAEARSKAAARRSQRKGDAGRPRALPSPGGLAEPPAPRPRASRPVKAPLYGAGVGMGQGSTVRVCFPYANLGCSEREKKTEEIGRRKRKGRINIKKSRTV